MRAMPLARTGRSSARYLVTMSSSRRRLPVYAEPTRQLNWRLPSSEGRNALNDHRWGDWRMFD
jgi:hypothetical protein